MKYLRARFTGYIGFYNGMNLNVVDIDFTKCLHNMILITGDNGTGKSTLLSHLNLFPDSSSSFIPNQDAEKYLVLSDGIDTYEIRLISASDLKGGRKTTKAYIKKNNIELNENGNVSSYKEIIFSEFELDSSYESLTSLSSIDRGLGDKTPSERKRFAANIIDNLEIYNNIYKTINKKSLIYKSHINTIHTKIQNIGMKDSLEATLHSLQGRERDLNAKIMDNNNRIVAIQTKSSIDEEEALKIKKLTEELSNLRNELDVLEISLDNFYHKTQIDKESVSNKLSDDNKLLSKYQASLESSTKEWRDKSSRLTTVSDSINSLEADLNSSNIDYNIKERYTKSTEKISELNKDIKNLINMNISINDIESIDEILKFNSKFIESLELFYDNLTSEDIKYIVQEYDKQSTEKLQQEQNSIIDNIESTRNKQLEITNKMKVVSILENRPSKCHIDSCPFIKEAVDINKNNKNLDKELYKVQDKLDTLSKSLSDIQNIIDYRYNMLPKKMRYEELKNMIKDISHNKFFDKSLLDFDNMLIRTSIFNNQRDKELFTTLKNHLLLLKSELENNRILEVENKAFLDKVKLIDSNNKLLEKLKNEKDILIEDIQNLKSSIDTYRNLIDSLQKNIYSLEEYNGVYKEYLDKMVYYNKIKERIDEFNKKSSKSLEALNQIQELKDNIIILSRELDPIMQDINRISGQLTLLDSYYKEYNEYKQSYDIIETIKKYCSPTGGGIQTLFMQLYMSKTLELSNQVLGMLFNGEYRLLDFIINESEFRIPFVGNGLPVDDISSGSNSQICIMGMIINLVLLHQASTKFNIARLDEIDGPLDTNNRFEFINALYQTMPLLNIEQLFLISHSIEADSSNVDIIKLKQNNQDTSTMGNIIFDYDKIIAETFQ